MIRSAQIVLVLILCGCDNQPPPRQPIDPLPKAEVELLRQQELAAENIAYTCLFMVCND